MLVEMQNYNYITILITVNNNSMAARVADDISVLIKEVLDLKELQADVPSTKEIKEVLEKFESFDRKGILTSPSYPSSTSHSSPLMTGLCLPRYVSVSM